MLKDGGNCIPIKGRETVISNQSTVISIEWNDRNLRKMRRKEKYKGESMKMNVRRIIVASCVLCMLLVFSVMQCLAGDSAEQGRATLDKLLKAVELNDYDSFVADGSDAFKAALTKSMLQGVSGQLSPRMKKGFSCLYIGELSQQGCKVLLWKITYKDGGDETLAKLVIKEGKVTGFWLQ